MAGSVAVTSTIPDTLRRRRDATTQIADNIRPRIAASPKNGATIMEADVLGLVLEHAQIIVAVVFAIIIDVMHNPLAAKRQSNYVCDNYSV